MIMSNGAEKCELRNFPNLIVNKGATHRLFPSDEITALINGTVCLAKRRKETIGDRRGGEDSYICASCASLCVCASWSVRTTSCASSSLSSSSSAAAPGSPPITF